MSDGIRIEATREIMLHVPSGVTLFSVSLLPDPDCGENRERIRVRAVAEDEAQARSLIGLTFERLAAAFAAPFDAELPSEERA